MNDADAKLESLFWHLARIIYIYQQLINKNCWNILRSWKYFLSSREVWNERRTFKLAEEIRKIRTRVTCPDSLELPPIQVFIGNGLVPVVVG